MSDKKVPNKNKKDDEEVEKLLDTTWDNWSSRRQCEQTHTPEYIKKVKNKRESDK